VLKSKYILVCLIGASCCILSASYIIIADPCKWPGTTGAQDSVTAVRDMPYGVGTSIKKNVPQQTPAAPEVARASTITGERANEQGILHETAMDSLGQSSISNTAPTHTDILSSDSGTDGGPAPTAPSNPVRAPIQYNAKDAIVFDVKNLTIHLYGAGNIEYDAIKLEAEEVLIDWKQHTITASSKKNEAGNVEKKTILTREGIEYIAESVRYSFESQRAVANKLFTKQGDSILRTHKVKKDSETTFYADRATYTTCDLAKPHFHIEAKRVKINQDDRALSGPFRLYFNGVPTPIGFPFGIFYFPQGSGIIPPKYGGESERGFCLQDGGYYIKLSNYVDLALQGSLYSKGSTDFTATANYKKRYRYSGDLRFERGIYLTPDESKLSRKYKSWHFLWNHNTEKNKNSSWHIQVDLASQNAYKIGGLLEDAIDKTRKDSSIRYTNRLVGFPLPYTADGSLRLNNSKSGKYEASLPEISLNTANMYPFRKGSTSGTDWLSNIHLRHKFEFQSRLSNSDGDRLDFLTPKDWSTLWKNGKSGAQHTVPLGANIKILRYLNLAPQMTHQWRWYGEKKEYRYDTKGNIKEDKVPGFVHVYDFDMGATLQTTCYGIYSRRRQATVQAIRHQFSPRLTFTYTPNFSEAKYWQTIHGGDKDGRKFDRFAGAVYPSPKAGEAAVLAINLSNRLDMKLKNRANSKKSAKKVPILESFDWSTSYDFLADQHAWGDIQFKTRTSLLDKLLDIRFESTFDPYSYKKNNQAYVRSNELAWNHGQGLGHMKKASLSIGASLGSSTSNETLKQDSRQKDDPDAQLAPTHLKKATKQYVGFAVPWKAQLNYRWDYTRLNPGDDAKKINSLDFEWHMSLTKKWEVSCKSAYDFNQKKLVGNSTAISIHRDLHCWEMDFNWNPLGDRLVYKFSVGLKAPLLKDIRLPRNRQAQKY